MKTNTLILRLILGIVISCPFFANADQLRPGNNGNLIVSSASDGTAPAYDCNAPTLPFIIIDGRLQASPEAAIGTIPSGEPLTVPEPSTISCQPVVGVSPETWDCEFTCEALDGTSVCIGLDCVDGEYFDRSDLTRDTLKLKENNLRIRFHDTTIPDELGQSWNIAANSEQHGGLSYFSFQVKSLEPDFVMISDGTALAYDCSAPMPYPLDPSSAVGTIPAGEPIIEPLPITDTCVFDSQVWMCTYDCSQEKLGYAVKPVFTLGTATALTPSFKDGVAIGYESAAEDGVISVGRDELMRRIAHVAKGIADTDVLTLEDLQFDPTHIERVALLTQRIAQANAQLDAIESEIALLEAIDFGGDGDVDGEDLAYFVSIYNDIKPQADLNGDGKIDAGDIATFAAVYGNF